MLGFACAWDDPRETTWSHTPWNLRAALHERLPVVDVPAELASTVQRGLKLLGARRVDGRWTTTWNSHPVTVALNAARLRRSARTSRFDIALQIGDLARLDRPYLIYQDLSWDLVLEHTDPAEGRNPQFPGVTLERLERLRARQHRIYRSATGIVAMSRWLADHLVAVTGLPAAKVFVVPPGANGLPGRVEPHRATGRGRRRRLLFVGKDFERKGGDLVVRALALLRRDLDPALELTVVGPANWPLPGAPPEGVRFLGRIGLAQITALFAEHDVFVMPSRFEGYGIALVEALAHGLPCVARNRCAMPEIVTPGVNGALVGTEDVGELAAAIAAVLQDDGLHAAVAGAAAGVAEAHSWRRAALDVERIVRAVS